MRGTVDKKNPYLKLAIWANLLFGLQNIYFYVTNDTIHSLLIGSLNIGVWVFYRGLLVERKDE